MLAVQMYFTGDSPRRFTMKRGPNHTIPAI
jgi:hypothetical protein